MENNMWKIENVSIGKLSLWDKNPRFPDKYFNKSEEELIKYLLSNKYFKIKEFAEAVVDEFDLPQLEKLVVYEYKGRLIVLEGNRRLTVYKLLNNPNLTGNDKLRSYFNRLKSKVDINKSFPQECLVTKHEEQALRYINRKHLQGNNEVGWGDTERAHHNFRRGNAKKKELFKAALTNIIRDLNIPEQMKEQVLGHGYVTTFYRILDSNAAWELFGFELGSDGSLKINDNKFNEKLKVIIFDVLRKQDLYGEKIDSRSLNKNAEKKSYLESINIEGARKVEEEIKKAKVRDIFGHESIDIKKTISKKSNPKSTSRNYLIPKTCTLKIGPQKINNVYRELKDDLLLDDSIKAVPNAVGVLFRVFLEISIDFFLEKEGRKLRDGIRLAGKIDKTAEYMEQARIAHKQQLINIRKVAVAKTDILSIDNFHDYVHSYQSQPSPIDLKTKWDKLQEFFEILWSHIDKKQSLKSGR